MNEISTDRPSAGASVRVPLAQSRQLDIARGLILLAAFISFVLSVSLWFSGSEQEGIFVGIWVPSIISLGAFLIPRRVER